MVAESDDLLGGIIDLDASGHVKVRSTHCHIEGGNFEQDQSVALIRHWRRHGVGREDGWFVVNDVIKKL